MKKFLAVLLSLCMVLTCMIPMLCAEETDAKETHEANTIRFNASDLTGGTLNETPDKMWVSTVSGKQGIGAMQFYWASKNATADDVPTFDISNMEFFEVQLYLSNVELFDQSVNFCFELTSGGIWDSKEDQMIKNWGDITKAAGVTLENGWNTIRIPLSLWPTGGADRTKINAFRFFCNGDMQIPEGEKLDYNIRSVGFGTAADGLVHSVPLISENGVGGTVSYYDYPSTRSWTIAAGNAIGSGKNFKFEWKNLESPIDISTYKYVDLRVKVTNAEELQKVAYQFELTSSGKADNNEFHYAGVFNNISEGWGTIRVPLAAISYPQGGDADLTAINFIRLFDWNGVAPTEDIQIELAYIEFSDGGDVNYKDYIFMPSSSAELPEGIKLTQEGSNVGDTGSILFADKDSAWVFEFDLENIDPSFIYLTTKLGGDSLKLQVAEKNEESAYVTIFDGEKMLPISGGRSYLINIGKYLSMAKFKPAGYKLYLRLSDYTTEDGNGGQICYNAKEPTILSVGYSDWTVDETYVAVTDEMLAKDVAEMERTEHSVPLFGCSAEIGGFTLDYKDYKNGCSSLAYKLGTWVDKDGKTVTQNGQAGFTFTTDEYAGEESIDASGMDTLEFWFYVSDVEAFKAISFGDNAMELTSAGTMDKEETNWRLSNILDQVTENGWNAIRLPFSAGGHTGETDWSRVNFMRWYFVNGDNLPEGEPVVIKIDDIRLTDYEAQQKELQKPIADAMGAKIEEKLGNIPEWNEDDADVIKQYEANRDTWEALYTDLKKEFDAMDSIAQDLVNSAGQKKIMTNVNRWIGKYDKYVKAQQEEASKGDDNKGENQGSENQGNENQGNENQGGENTEKPDDTNKPDDKTDDTKKDGGNATVVIVIVVIVVVVAAAAVAVFFVLKKKKNA